MEIIDLCRSKLLFEIGELSQESQEKTLLHFVGQERKKDERKKEIKKERKDLNNLSFLSPTVKFSL